ncbi:MAG: hypothetical protein RLZZ628_1248 [Bacteroidota bacterium]|jgi:major vault protein
MDFYANGINIIRDTVLGLPNEQNKRPGKLFSENNMRIYDVEIFDIKLGDAHIEKMLIQAQQDVITQNLGIRAEKRRLLLTTETESINRSVMQSKADTQSLALSLAKKEIELTLQNSLARIEADAKSRSESLEAELNAQSHLEKINATELSIVKSKGEVEIALAELHLQQRLLELKAEVDATVSKAAAVSPNLIAALQSFSNRALAEKVAVSMSPLSILGGKSVADVFSSLLKGTILSDVLEHDVE